MPADRQQGFSLLEILIAFSILALSLGILLKIFSGGVNSALVAEEYNAAAQIAETLMSTQGVETPLQIGKTSGQEGGKYDWQVEIGPYQFIPANSDSQTATADLLKVKVIVSWDDDNVQNQARQIELTTLKLVNKANGPQ